jgi:FkbM family methyltransferase
MNAQTTTLPARAANLGGILVMTGDRQPTFWNKVDAGLWEPETLATLKSNLSLQTTFLDIGAWVGPTTLFGAAHAAHVIAVEADPAALSQLRINLALNPALAGKVTLVDRAISAASADVRFGAGRKPGDSMSSALFAQTSATTWTSPSVTPDELVKMIAPETSLFIKLDIEGGEYALLPAMGPLISRADRGLLLSFHPRNLMASLAGDAEAFARTTKAAVLALESLQAQALTAEGTAVMPIAKDELYSALLSDAASLTYLFKHSAQQPSA